MAALEAPAWLKNLPLAPEYRPTETEFADPIAFISRIEREAAAFGICKVIPPLPKPSKKFVVANLNRSLSASPDLNGAAPSGAVFTTRQQELGSRRARGPASNFAPASTQKQVWQSGEFYTLEQFEAKSKAFARSQLGAKDVSPMLVESLFWKAAAEKPIYVEYANDVPGSAFATPEEPFRYVSYKRKRKRGFDGGTTQELKRPHPEPVPAERLEGAGGAGWKLSNSPWNLQVIARSPGSLTRFMPDEIPGVTSPMVYIGMLFSWFAWHVEDHELHSLNFLHIGAPKTWYAVPGDYAANLEEIVRLEGYGGNMDRLAALTMLGEKTTLLSPEILVASGLPCCRLVQHPGEFVVTFPRAYHVGFSHGFNCGEAANFATPQWLKVAKEAAIRRAAMNYLPMLSHQQLLYMLTMSFIPSAPGEILSGARTSRLRDRKKEEREIMVKKAFLNDMMKEENLFFALLARESTCYAVLWDPELLPAPSVDAHGWKMMQCSSRKDSLCDKSNDRCVQNEEASSNLLSQSPPMISSTKCQNNEDHHNCSSTQIEEMDMHASEGDLPFGLNVDSGSLACVACGILGYPLMAILQPSDNASKELFPFSDKDCIEACGKPRVSNEGSFVPYIIDKLDSDFGKHSDRSDKQKIPDLCSNLGIGKSGHSSLHEGSNNIGESFSHFAKVPNVINSTDDANSRDSCDTGPVSVSGISCFPITSVETDRGGESTSNVDHKEDELYWVHKEDELYQEKDMTCPAKEITCCTSEDDTKHVVDLLSLSDGMDTLGSHILSNMNAFSSSEKSNEQLSLEDEEHLKEATKKKYMKTTENWTTTKGFLRPRIFCLQHALEVEELLHTKGGARVLLICHTDYLKIKALAISIAEEINVPLSGKDLPLDNASTTDLDIINISIDDEGHEEDGKDWTSRLGLNLKYCVKLRKQSTSNQEHLTLALDGIDSDPSPLPFLSNLKWLSRRPRTPYKVIGTTVSKLVVRNSIDDSSDVMKAYSNCEIRSSGKGHCVSSQKIIQHSGSNNTALPVYGNDESSTHNHAQTSGDKFLDSESRLFTIPIIVAEYPQAHQVSWEIPRVVMSNEFQGEFSSKYELAHSENSKDMKIISTLGANEIVKSFPESGLSSNNEDNAVAWRTCAVSDFNRMFSEDRLVCPTLLPNNSEMCLQVKTVKAPLVNDIVASLTNEHGPEIDISASVKKILPGGSSRVEDEVHITESPCDILVNDDSKMQTETPFRSNANDLVENKVTSVMNNLVELPDTTSTILVEVSVVQRVIDENTRNFCPAKNDLELNDLQGNNAQSSRHDLIPYVRRKKRNIEKKPKEACPSSAIGFIRSPCEGLRPRSRHITDSVYSVMDKVEKKVTFKHRVSGHLVASKCKKKAFKCDIEGCHMSFDTKKDFNLHKHNRCTFDGCRKPFSSHASLVRHQCVHSDARPFKCPWSGCNMSFKWQWAKIEHVRLHTGERPYVCEASGCGLTFRFVSDFSRHRRKTGHLTNTPENC